MENQTGTAREAELEQKVEQLSTENEGLKAEREALKKELSNVIRFNKYLNIQACGYRETIQAYRKVLVEYRKQT